MNTESNIHEPDENTSYQIDVVTRMTGITRETILLYQETGLLSSHPDGHPLDPDDLLTLRRIDHLQNDLGLQEPALRLILGLLAQIDELKRDLRRSS